MIEFDQRRADGDAMQAGLSGADVSECHHDFVQYHPRLTIPELTG